MKRWYVAYTQAQAEFQAVSHLQRQGMETYLPLYRKLRRHARRSEVVRAPLFPRYVFVALDLSVNGWRSVNGTRGVCRLVCHGERPAPVAEGVVEAIRAGEDDEGCVSLESLALFERGTPMRVLDGTFAGHTGVYERMSPDERVVLLLDMLGHTVEVTLPIHAVEAA